MTLGYQKYGTFSEKDRAWLVLEQYLRAAKKHEVETIKQLSYQIGDSCAKYGQTASSTEDCDRRMDTVAFFGSTLKKSDFKNMWSDSKQIILTTELERMDNATLASLSKAIIYFVVDKNGTIKLLKFNDSVGISIMKENRSMEEIDGYLNKVMADEDLDGKLDEIELCIGQPEICIKTDPKQRDTDGDGFWDGTEAQFYEET